jgi:hypothetical protein
MPKPDRWSVGRHSTVRLLVGLGCDLVNMARTRHGLEPCQPGLSRPTGIGFGEATTRWRQKAMLSPVSPSTPCEWFVWITVLHLIATVPFVLASTAVRPLISFATKTFVCLFLIHFQLSSFTKSPHYTSKTLIKEIYFEPCMWRTITSIHCSSWQSTCTLYIYW